MAAFPGKRGILGHGGRERIAWPFPARFSGSAGRAIWQGLEPQAREMMAEFVNAEGRPMVYDLRAVCDVIASLVRNGIECKGGNSA